MTWVRTFFAFGLFMAIAAVGLLGTFYGLGALCLGVVATVGGVALTLATWAYDESDPREEAQDDPAL